ncbi:MAG TPA: hypothetical protein VNQ90_21165, partial [Chthoniobacteraceae bacterium]|nr:hypothetical protein [Chthoniobacteraceae bacterium]
SLFLRPPSGSMMGESNSPGVSLRSTPGFPAVSPPGYSLADTTFNHTRCQGCTKFRIDIGVVS